MQSQCTLVSTHHEPPHPLLLDPLLLLLLHSLQHGIVVEDSLTESRGTYQIIAMELLEVSGVSHDAVQILLQQSHPHCKSLTSTIKTEIEP